MRPAELAAMRSHLIESARGGVDLQDDAALHAVTQLIAVATESDPEDFDGFEVLYDEIRRDLTI